MTKFQFLKIKHSVLELCFDIRNYILVIIVLASFFLPQSASAGTIIHPPSYLGLQQGLVGCWTFDGSYAKAPDCSGNGNTGTLTNGPLKTTGQIGQAVSFDGVDDYVTATAPSSLNAPASVTVSAWVYLNSLSDYTGFVTHMSDVPYHGFSLLTQTSPYKAAFHAGGTYASNVLQGTTTLVAGRWYHMVGIYNGTNSLIYLNGVLENSAARTNNLDVSNEPIDIGADYIRQSGMFTNGKIDDVRIFNRALSQAEISRMYKIGLGSKQNRAAGGDALDKGLVGHWTMDGRDISGTRAKDSSGQNNHGTLTLGPKQATGRLGQALSFDGVDDYVLTPSVVTSEMKTSGYSLSFWMYAKALPDFKGAMAIQGILNDTGPTMGVYTYSSGIRAYTSDIYSSVIPLSLNTWYHVVLSYAGNGSKVATLSVNGGRATVSVTGTTNQGTGTKLWIGNGYNGYFNGSIDDVRIYNRALSAGEVNRLYMMEQPKVNVTQTTLEKGLVGHWSFDGSNISGTRAKDSSGQNNHGTLTNGPLQAVGRVGQALSFDGTNDYVNVGDSFYSDTLTVCAWIYPTLIDTNIRSIVIKRNDSNNNSDTTLNEWSLTLDTSTKFRYISWDSSSVVAVDVSSSVAPATNKWQHVCGVQSGNGKPAYVYVNGAQSSPFTQLAAMRNSSSYIQIGSRSNGDNNRYFKGIQDDVRIYNRALSAGEVNKLYQMGR